MTALDLSTAFTRKQPLALLCPDLPPLTISVCGACPPTQLRRSNTAGAETSCPPCQHPNRTKHQDTMGKQGTQNL